MNDEVFSVYAALNDLNKRVKRLEGQVPDYNADLLEVGRTIGALVKRVAELEALLGKGA